MVMFGDPFVGNVQKKLSNEELIQALRVDIAGELEAILAYDAHAMATDDERVKTILYSIRDEERQHVGELIHLMEILDSQEAQFLAQGKQEVDQLLKGKYQPMTQHGLPGMGGQMQETLSQETLTGQAGAQGTVTAGGPMGAAMQEAQIQKDINRQQYSQHQQAPSFPYPPYPGNLGHRNPNNFRQS